MQSRGGKTVNIFISQCDKCHDRAKPLCCRSKEDGQPIQNDKTWEEDQGCKGTSEEWRGEKRQGEDGREGEKS